jgi:hypothetical protein
VPSSGLPGTLTERAAPRPLFGLAPGGVCRATSVTGGAVRSYRTLSPLPVPPWGGHRRFAFCCTFRRLAAPGRYPAPCPAELGLSSTPEGAAVLTRLPTCGLRCPGEDSNLHAVSGTRSLVWPVYQFQHLGSTPGRTGRAPTPADIRTKCSREDSNLHGLAPTRS